MVKGSIADFIEVKQIDSFQKLRLLLFLYQRPEVAKSLQQLAERLYLGHLPLLERILNDLRLAGLVERVGSHYQLSADPQVGSEGQLAVGEMMSLTLSVDHRIADGAIAAQYLQELRRLLESPMSLLI